MRREEEAVARLMEPVRVRLEVDEVEGARLRDTSSEGATAGEEMYEMLERLLLRGVSVSGLEADLAGDEEVSFWSKLRRRGKACREGVEEEVGVEKDANPDWSI